MSKQVEVPVFIERGTEPVGTLAFTWPEGWPEGDDSHILLTPCVEGEPGHEHLIGVTLRMLPNPQARLRNA